MGHTKIRINLKIKETQKGKAEKIKRKIKTGQKREIRTKKKV